MTFTWTSTEVSKERNVYGVSMDINDMAASFT
jgi:hypothetical protein